MSGGEKVLLVDAMLGKLTRFLRILGYNTLYVRDESDNEILDKLAKTPDAILITGDKDLFITACKRGFNACYIDSNMEIAMQLRKLREMGIIEIKFNAERTRCPICNEKLVLKAIEGSKILWVCRKCNKEYWIGKHWKNINKTLQVAKNE
ncbi:hypothetical protein DRO02_01050 [archaeon]|nr:MAG: hypothetical protein DRO02_01050 [archaeon]